MQIHVIDSSLRFVEVGVGLSVSWSENFWFFAWLMVFWWSDHMEQCMAWKELDRILMTTLRRISDHTCSTKMGPELWYDCDDFDAYMIGLTLDIVTYASQKASYCGRRGCGWEEEHPHSHKHQGQWKCSKRLSYDHIHSMYHCLADVLALHLDFYEDLC